MNNIDLTILILQSLIENNPNDNSDKFIGLGSKEEVVGFS
jgi:hypothetical protein